MISADPERNYVTMEAYDSKGISLAWSEKLMLCILYYHNFLWSSSTSSLLNEFPSQVVQVLTLGFLCAGFIPKSKIKRKISHFLIHMDFIGH